VASPCECGRHARSLPRRLTRRSSRRARAGVPRALKHHPLCLRCWPRELWTGTRRGSWRWPRAAWAGVSLPVNPSCRLRVPVSLRAFCPCLNHPLPFCTPPKATPCWQARTVLSGTLASCCWRPLCRLLQDPVLPLNPLGATTRAPRSPLPSGPVALARLPRWGHEQGRINTGLVGGVRPVLAGSALAVQALGRG
jgi:hypothetical protein